MKKVQKNSLTGNLKPCWTVYKAWGKKGRKIFLRFSKSGEENIEKLWATHFVWIDKLKQFSSLILVNKKMKKSIEFLNKI